MSIKYSVGIHQAVHSRFDGYLIKFRRQFNETTLQIRPPHFFVSSIIIISKRNRVMRTSVCSE